MKKYYKKAFIALALLLFYSASFAQILDPVKWTFSSEKTSDSTADLKLTGKIGKGWHMYSQFIKPGGPLPTEFKFDKSKDFQLLGKVTEPKGNTEFDSAFMMKIQQFTKTATFIQKIKVLSDKKFSVKGTVNYMACSGVSCLPPKDVDIAFTLEGYKKAKAVVVLDTIPEKPKTDTTQKIKKDTTTKISATSGSNDITGKGGSLWWIFLTGFLAGLAGVITPCVFPMIPMTVSFFMRNSEKRSKARRQAIFYGISIIFIYTCIGLIISALLGPAFIAWLSTHWVPNILFFLLFLIFALSFLGMFEIVMPSWLVNKSDKQVEKGGFVGTFFMALTLVLVSFSCTAPIVGALLVQAATGQVIEPAIGMFGFSLAFALPFTLLAFFPALLAKMPKSGGWMNSVKVVLGFFILALGMKYLVVPDQVYHWNLLSRDIFLAIWIVIFSMMGFYLLGKLKLKHDSDLPHVSIFRLILSIVVFTFVIYLITGLFGSPLKSISSLLPPQETSFFMANNSNTTTGDNKSELCEKPKYSDILHFPADLKLQGYFDYAQGMACAKKMHKPVLLDFNGHACAKCKEMEAKVWSNDEVLKRLKENYLIISLFTDDRQSLPEAEWVTSTFDGKVKKTIGDKNADYQTTRYKVNANPFYVLLDNAGEILVPPRGYDLSIDNYIKFLDDGQKEFNKRNKQ